MSLLTRLAGRAPYKHLISFALVAAASCTDGPEDLVLGRTDQAVGSGPSVASDKADYAPGETALLSGAGWEANEDVFLQVVCTNGFDDMLFATADDAGAFEGTQYPITVDHLGVKCDVTATGQTSNVVATTSFTDGNVRIFAGTTGTSFTLTYSLHTGTNCTGAVVVQGQSPISGTETVVNGTSQNHAVKDTESLKLVATATSLQSTAFTNWTSSDPSTPSAPTTSMTICVPGFQGTGNRQFTANYAAVPPPPTNRNPSVTCSNVTQTTTPGSCTATASVITSKSDPDGDTVTCTETPAGPYGLGATSVTVSCSDGKGGTASCSGTVTLSDDDAPSVTCPAPQTRECTSPSGTTATVTASANDNCAGSLAASCANNGGTFPLGTTSGNCTATDGDGNTGSCGYSVTVVDTTKPSIACPAPTTAECTGNHQATVDPGNASGSDVCGNTTVSGPGAGNYPLGTTSTAYSATDASGNANSCTSSVTVTDTMAPSISCPAAVTAECTGNHSSTIDVGPASASDVCGSVSVNDIVAQAYPLGTTSVTHTATDEVGLVSSCTQSVTVADTTAPEITCPPAVTAECTGNHSSTIDVAPASASDVCGSVSVNDIGSQAYPLGTTSVTHTATDDSGLINSCTQSVTVADTTAPTISCPGPAVAECTGNHSAAVNPGTATAADVCGGVTVSGPGAGYYPLGTTSVAYSATDESGLAASCASTVTVADTTAPSITCPAPVTAECTGNHMATVDVAAASTSDVCGATTPSDPATASYPLGTTTVSLSTTDDVGNANSCTSSVTVVDTTAPSVTCAAPVVVECTGNGAALVDVAAPTANDVCGSVSVSDPAAQSYPLGTTSVTGTATDDSGLTATCGTTVTVRDTTAPTFNTLAPQTILGSCASTPLTFTRPTAVDGCQTATVTCSPLSGNSFGTNYVTCTATDPSGNSASTTIQVNVLQPLRIAFNAPLADDNTPDNLDTDADVANVFTVKSTIPHQVNLYSCSGADVTTSVAVTVNIAVTLKDGAGAAGDSNQLTAFTGVGDAGGLMALVDGKYKYNLKTTGYKTGTAASSLYFDSVVKVAYTNAPSITAAAEDVRLESK